MRRTIQWLMLVFVFLGLAGCPQNPATMTQSQVEGLLKETLSLKEVTITPNATGDGFSGTGKAADGTNVKLTVTQDAKARKLSYSSENDSGDIDSGSVQLK